MHARRILVIQPWTVDRARVETAVREAGVDASFRRADFEAAVLAALAHEAFDVIIFDESTPDLTRETIATCLEVTARDALVITLGEIATLAARLASHRN